MNQSKLLPVIAKAVENLLCEDSTSSVLNEIEVLGSASIGRTSMTFGCPSTEELMDDNNDPGNARAGNGGQYSGQCSGDLTADWHGEGNFSRQTSRERYPRFCEQQTELSFSFVKEFLLLEPLLI